MMLKTNVSGPQLFVQKINCNKLQKWNLGFSKRNAVVFFNLIFSLQWRALWHRQCPRQALKNRKNALFPCRCFVVVCATRRPTWCAK